MAKTIIHNHTIDKSIQQFHDIKTIFANNANSINNIIHSLSDLATKLGLQITIPPLLPLSPTPPTSLYVAVAGSTTATPNPFNTNPVFVDYPKTISQPSDPDSLELPIPKSAATLINSGTSRECANVITNERPKLDLKPRSLPVEQLDESIEKERESVFGKVRNLFDQMIKPNKLSLQLAGYVNNSSTLHIFYLNVQLECILTIGEKNMFIFDPGGYDLKYSKIGLSLNVLAFGMLRGAKVTRNELFPIDKSISYPTYPPLTCYKESLSSLTEKKYVECIIFDEKMTEKMNHWTVSKLCAKLNTLLYIWEVLNAIKDIQKSWKTVQIEKHQSFKEIMKETSISCELVDEMLTNFGELRYCVKALFSSSSLWDVIAELLDYKQQETIKILGCEILTRFINSQEDNIYAHNIENLVLKVCNLASKDCKEYNKLLRAASLQCLAAMIGFMTKYQCFFDNIDEIVCTTLQKYGIEKQNKYGDQRQNPHHNWVDEVVRSETRDVANPTNDVRPITFLPKSEFKISSNWSHICIQNLTKLAKENTTIRYVFDPIFIYFDTGKHWAAGNGLALHVLQEMFYFVVISRYEQMILSSIIRHLDHKNVMHDPQMKSDIIQVAICLVQQLRSQSVVAEISAASDLCRHLRKSIQVNMEAVERKESNGNNLLRKFIEGCLLEIAKGVDDAYPLFDLMAITMEKLPTSAAVESLLSQLIRTMMHPDLEAHIEAHKIFSVILFRTPAHPNCKYEHNKRQSKSTSAFTSATVFEKLKKGKEFKTSDMFQKQTNNGGSIKEIDEDGFRNGRTRRSPPYIHKLSSAETEINIITLNEDQIAQLFSAFWLQANQLDNLPENYETIVQILSLSTTLPTTYDLEDKVVFKGMVMIRLCTYNIGLRE